MSKFKILSRRNLLIYETENELFFKTTHYQLTASSSKVSKDILKKILKKTRQVTSIDTLCSLLKIQEDELLQYIKLLKDIGAIFIFQSDISLLEPTLIDLLCIYSESNFSIDDFIENVDDIYICIPDQFTNLFGLLRKLNLNCQLATVKEVQIKSDRKSEKIYLSQNCYNDIFFDIEHKYNQKKFDYSKLNHVQKLMFDHYFSIFIIKKIIGNDLVGAVLNHEGQFEEFKFNQNHFEKLLSDINIPTNPTVDINRQVRILENILQSNKFPYSLSKHRNSDLATVSQHNKVVFGIHDDLRKKEFLFAGTDFLISFVDMFITALQYSLEQLSGKSWIVCRTEDYYEKKLDKICEIVYVGEEWYIIDEYRLNSEFDIKVIQGKNSGLYNFVVKSLKTKDIFKFYTPFSNVEDSKKYLEDNIALLETKAQLLYDTIFESQNDEQFIRKTKLDINVKKRLENLQKKFEEMNINYSEKKWIYEQTLDEVGIVVRQIEVDEYGKSS